MLGINNRDLGTFQVDLQNNKVIMDSAPGQQVHLRSSLHVFTVYTLQDFASVLPAPLLHGVLGTYILRTKYHCCWHVQ